MPKLDFGSGLSGAGTGALAGASAFGLPGAAIGGLIGGIGGLFGNKKKKKPKKRSTLDPQQQALYDDYIKSIRGEGPFSQNYNFDSEGYNDVFDQSVARPANRNFQENIIPGITGQFRKQGIQNSTYAGEGLARAGRDVQENLDALRSQNVFQGQQQANMNRQNALTNILGMQTSSYDKPGPQQPGLIDQVLGSMGPAAGEWFADYLRRGRATDSPTNPAYPTSPTL